MKDYVHVDTLKVDFEMTASAQTLVPPFIYNFKNKTNAANVKYMWDFGDGYTEASANPVHIYNTPGNFNVRLIAFSKNGCTNSKSVSNNIQMGTSLLGE
jgi:PKD repeat protein